MKYCKFWAVGLLAATMSSVVAAQPAAVSSGSIHFEDCDLLDRDGVPRAEAQCARFEVPENPAAPDGRQISLRIARIEARVPGQHDDPVVLLAGGPGQSAVEAYLGLQSAFRRLNRKRDVLLVDQRGTGGSNRLACPEMDLDESLDVDAEDWRAAAEECLAHLETRADLRFYTTSDYIADLERVRAALGSPQFNLYGGSYGSRVGQEYLRQHPGAIRSVVLDGVMPPTVAMPSEHARNLDQALAMQFARCAEDAACAERLGDMAVTLQQLRKRLQAAPVERDYHDAVDFSAQSGAMNADFFGVLLRMYAYQPESAALLPFMVHEAAAGQVGPMLAQIDQVIGGLTDQLAHGMELSVLCAEDAPRLRVLPEPPTSIMGSEMVEATLAQCEVWPRGNMPEGFDQPLVSDKPVLVLSGEFDPVTPARYGVQVVETLSQGRHLVAPGQGHIVMTRGCMPKLVSEFLDTLDAAALEAECIDTLGATPFFLDYNGFAP